MLNIGTILFQQVLSSPTERKPHQTALDSPAPEIQYCLLYKVLHYLPTLMIKGLWQPKAEILLWKQKSTGWWVKLFQNLSASALCSIPRFQHGLWGITSTGHCVHTMRWGRAHLSWQVPCAHAVLHLTSASWLSRSREHPGTASTALAPQCGVRNVSDRLSLLHLSRHALPFGLMGTSVHRVHSRESPGREGDVWMIDAVTEHCSQRTWPVQLFKGKQHILVMSNVILQNLISCLWIHWIYQKYLLALTRIVMAGIFTGEDQIIK